VNAAEEEALRRMHEKQKTKRKEDDKGQRRNVQREAQKRVESVERRVEDLEAKIAQLTEVLGDPELYMSEDGKRRALKAGSDLDNLKRKLDSALEEWSAATEAADSTAR
jgi:ATP-binding cassette subfamily F protein 3